LVLKGGKGVEKFREMERMGREKGKKPECGGKKMKKSELEIKKPRKGGV